jgi:hypothetical protein
MLSILHTFPRRSTKTKVERRSLIMKSFQNRVLAIAAVGFFALCASAIPAAAQKACAGSFTLQHEVRWQGARLPAGDYTFSMKSVAAPSVITLYGPDGFASVSAIGADKDRVSDRSTMTIEHRGGASMVRELYLAPIGLRLTYSVPKRQKDQKLAQGPATTEQVLVAMAAK